MKRFAMLCLLTLLCSCCFATMAAAQSASSATIVGEVVDPQGAVVARAEVTAINQDTGASRTVTTTSTGNYLIPNLAPGTYTVKVSAKGFAEGSTKDVKLQVGDQRDLSFKLAVAGSSQTVEVTTTAPLIETTKTDVSSSVTDLDMQRLPTISPASGAANDYAQLALTAPGVKVDANGAGNSISGGDLIGPGSMNNRGNLYNVDGANITDQLVSGRDGLGASVDEIQEFQVITNNYNAEYGQAGGLVLNAVTKSGSNQIHGDGHMYFRGRNFAASDPFYNLSLLPGPISGAPRAPFHRQEGGFTVGGPFHKDKFFWFASYELAHQGLSATLFTPVTGFQILPQPTNNLLYSAKMDYNISPKHVLSARYNVDRLFSDNSLVQSPNGNNVTPDSMTALTNHVNGLNVGLVSTLKPNLINEARFGWLRFLQDIPDKTTLPGQVHPGYYTGADFCCPQGGLQKRYQYIDNLTWSHGKHTLKTGFNISYYPWFSLFQQFHFGQYRVTAANVPTSFTFGAGPAQVTSKDNIYGFYIQDTWHLSTKFTVNAGLRYDLEAGAFKGGTVKGPNGTCFQANGLIPACSSDKNNWQPRLGFTYGIGDKTLVRASFAEITQLAFNNVVLDSLNFDGKNLRTVTTTNPAVLGAFPNFPNPALLAGPACPPNCGNVRPISDHLRNPEVRAFNFGIEHQFTKTLVADIQYIGQFGFGLFGERDTNAAPVLADPAHPGFFFFGDRPDSNFLKVRTNENSRTSHYNGLLISATKKFSNHIQFNGSYTWSHAITSGEDFFGLSEPGDPRDIHAELGPALNDVRHAANFGVVIDSGRWTTNRYAGWFINDVGLSFIGQLQSGRPYPLSTGTAGFGDGIFFGVGNETQQRPNVLPDGTISTAGIASAEGTNALFGPGAVAACIAAGLPAAQCNSIQNTFIAPASASSLGAIDALTGDVVDFKLVNGNVQRNAARGSGFYRTDVSLKKEFRIANTEHVRLELRADAINVFNHSNWQNFNSNDVTNVMPLSLDPTGAPNADFFTCTACMRPNGTFAGANGQLLHLSDLQHGKLDSNLLAPTFNGLGNPASPTDGPRKFQLSFHVRY